MDIKVISGHGGHISKPYKTLPSNSYLIYLTPFSKTSTENQDNTMLCVLKNWITLYKQIKDEDESKYKKILKKSIYYYLFKDERIKMIEYITKILNSETKNFQIININNNETIDEFNKMDIKQQYKYYINLDDILKKQFKDILILANENNTYLLFIFNFYHFIKKHDNYCILLENKSFKDIKNIMIFWEKNGFDDIVRPEAQFMDLSIDFLTIYNSVNSKYVHFFYGGVSNVNEYIYRKPLSLIIKKKSIHKKQKNVDKDISDLTERRINIIYKDDIIEASEIQYNITKDEEPSYFKNNIFGIIKETLKYDTTKLYKNLIENVNNPSNRSKNISSFLKYKISDIIQNDTIYIISACRVCSDKECLLHSALTPEHKKELLHHFLNYEYTQSL